MQKQRTHRTAKIHGARLFSNSSSNSHCYKNPYWNAQMGPWNILFQTEYFKDGGILPAPPPTISSLTSMARSSNTTTKRLYPTNHLQKRNDTELQDQSMSDSRSFLVCLQDTG